MLIIGVNILLKKAKSKTSNQNKSIPFRVDEVTKFELDSVDVNLPSI